ncbi:MAG: DNA polymerase III subunit chi [Magnetovibrionaceae bacterium]
MTEIAFYHLERTSLEKALPKLLEKTYGLGKRALVRASSDARVEQLNGVLWTYDQDAWLPHGSKKDGEASEQPIWLSVDSDNPNGASFLFLTDGAEQEDVAGYERCFDLFDGSSEEAVQAARLRWKRLKDAGHLLTYWQQTPQGRWEKKATANEKEESGGEA